MFVEERTSQSDRLVLLKTDFERGTTTFADDVRTGFTSQPKALRPKYFYDKLGSRLFEAICCLPEYHVTRDEHEILEKYSTEIIDTIALAADRGIRLIELGSGNSEKTRQLIARLLSQTDLHYIPIDISEASLARSSEELLQVYPRLRITAYAGDYLDALDALKQTADSNRLPQRTIVAFMGSSIGNVTPEESVTLLRQVRRLLNPDDVMLLGADLKKSLDVLLPAYNDALNVTAAFNLNLLVRINQELGGEFKIGEFEHRALYNGDLGRIEMHLFSRVAQSVLIKSLDLEVKFAAGESVHTESSYKFDHRMLADLAARAGFSLERTWHDNNRRFSFNLFVAQGAEVVSTSNVIS
jgi:dimethylhistidine N-methyltransferase